MNSTFKVCFIGAPGSGKTTFLLRHSTGDFRQDYIPTKGSDVIPLQFQTTEGLFTLRIWDTAGDPEFEGLRDGYYVGADAAVAFYDRNNISRTYELVRDFERACPGAPIINVWNKCDLKLESAFIKANLKHNRQVICQGNRPTYQVSALSNHNFEKPFLDILRSLTKKRNLCFSEYPKGIS